jgi:hypothetical protein
MRVVVDLAIEKGQPSSRPGLSSDRYFVNSARRVVRRGR